MGNPRQPKLLPAKLLAIREFLNIRQADMASKLQSEILSHSSRRHKIEPAHVTEYEKGEREPNLLVLIAYVRLGHVHMESIVDDDVIIDQFRTRLGKEFDYATLPTGTKSNKKRVIAAKRNAKVSATRLGDFVRRTAQRRICHVRMYPSEARVSDVQLPAAISTELSGSPSSDLRQTGSRP